MPKKGRPTQKQIEQDIIYSLNENREMPEADYIKTKIIAAATACLLVLVMFFNHKLGLILMVTAIVLTVCIGVISLLLRKKIKTVSIDDYDITSEVLSDTVEETYIQKSRHHHRTVSSYTLRFENGKSWRIPKDNYIWSSELRMSDFAVYQSSHRGDTFTVVSKKDTGEIVMAYHSELFVLRLSQ